MKFSLSRSTNEAMLLEIQQQLVALMYKAGKPLSIKELTMNTLPPSSHQELVRSSLMRLMTAQKVRMNRDMKFLLTEPESEESLTTGNGDEEDYCGSLSKD